MTNPDVLHSSSPHVKHQKQSVHDKTSMADYINYSVFPIRGRICVCQGHLADKMTSIIKTAVVKAAGSL